LQQEQQTALGTGLLLMMGEGEAPCLMAC
jgi:hypothetical protein